MESAAWSVRRQSGLWFMPKMRRGALRRAFGLVGAGIWCMEEPAGFLGGPPGSLKSTHYNPRRNPFSIVYVDAATFVDCLRFDDSTHRGYYLCV
jgi:hypothetical protein